MQQHATFDMLTVNKKYRHSSTGRGLFAFFATTTLSLRYSVVVSSFSITPAVPCWKHPHVLQPSYCTQLHQSLTSVDLVEPKNTTEVTPPTIQVIENSENTSINLVAKNSESFEQTELSLTVEQITDLPTSDEYKRGMAIIACITVLFSSNSPVLHSAFVSVSQGPPVLLLNAMTSLVALAGIFIGGPILNASIPLPCIVTEDPAKSCQDAPEDLSTWGGMELGTWKMLGTTANLYGLSLTSADHGAFLIQLTTLIVPAVQGFLGVPIPKRIWTAIALALVGVAFFTLDQGGGGGANDMATTTSLQGDALCVVAAIFYGTYDLRLFEWGKKVQPLKLIRKKIAVQASLSLVVLAALGREESVQYIQAMLDNGINSSHDLIIIGSVVLWSGVIINAIVPFLQVGGQQAVGATRAQVVYASQPLWAALISLCLLGETLGKEGIYGGVFFLAAIFLAASAEMPEPNCEQDICEV